MEQPRYEFTRLETMIDEDGEEVPYVFSAGGCTRGDSVMIFEHEADGRLFALLSVSGGEYELAELRELHALIGASLEVADRHARQR